MADGTENSTRNVKSGDTEAQATLGACVQMIGKRALHRIPAKARFAVITGSLVLIALAIYTFVSSGSSTLNLICHHNFQNGEITVFVDGNPSYTNHISGTLKKRFGVFGKRFEGTFSASLAVSSGEHSIQVHVISASDRFDQTKTCEINAERGKDGALVIDAQRAEMSLAYEGAATTTKALGSSIADTLHSILITLGGSAASAAIGFFVQDFLRSKKTA